MFGLNGQIEHKLAFLRKCVPGETSLVLVGHSIGCYIILEMMKRNPELKVSCYISQSLSLHYIFRGTTIKHLPFTIKSTRRSQGGTLKMS